MIRAIVTMPKKMISMIMGTTATMLTNNDEDDDNHNDDDDDDDDWAHAGLQASMSRKCGGAVMIRIIRSS